MTSRGRMLKALRHGIPDRVPCSPDISIMVPLRLKNRPFWECYIDFENLGNIYDLYLNKKLMYAYLDAVRYFGLDGWFFYGNPKIKSDDVMYKQKIVERQNDKIITRTTMYTPEGNLWAETIYPINDPPIPYRKYIKDFKREFKFLKYFYPKLDEIDFSDVIEMKKFVGENGITGINVVPPSLSHLDNIVDGGLSVLGTFYYDNPKIIKKYKEMHERWSVKYLKKVLEANLVDEIITGGSGLITWQGPKITRELSLDGLKKITRLCKKHDVISHIHCCGFSKELVKMCAEETDLDAIEPLEGPPQGDVNLKEVKKKYGNKLALKGNLHTSRVMMQSVKEVEKAAIRCIEDAAEGGGYILSTGDQCGRDTPLENIFKLVEVCEKYGKY